MKGKIVIGLYALAGVILQGCTLSVDIDKTLDPITFGVRRVTSKGKPVMTTSSIASMCVSAAESDLPFDSNTVVGNLMSRVEVFRNGAEWETDCRYYFPFSGYVSFFAYAPYIAQDDICNDNCYSEGFYELIYSPDTSVSNQVDFCVAHPVLDRIRHSGKVNFQFEHTTTKVLFSAYYVGQLPEDVDLYVDRITLSGVAGTAHLGYDSEPPYFSWSDYGVDGVQYKLTRDDNQLINNALSNDSSDGVLNGPDTEGTMFLLPQTLVSGANIIVEFGWYSGGEKIKSRSELLNLPVMNWNAGECVTYKLKVDANQMSLQIADWDSNKITGSIGD